MPEQGQIHVKINGERVQRVIAVSFACDTTGGPDGSPQTDRPRADRIIITRESDERTDFWSWALQPYAEGYRNGEIEFLRRDKDKKTLRKVEWKGGWVSAYSENVPDTQDAQGSPMTETIEISAREIDYGGVKIVAWKE